MQLVESHDATRWDNWLRENGGVFSFLQSSLWAGVIKKLGRTVEMIEIVDEGEVVAHALIDYRPAMFGKLYAFCPKGPVMSKKVQGKREKEQVEMATTIIENLRTYAKSKNCIFLRIEPTYAFSFLLSPFSSHSVRDINPPATLLLDLAPTREQLLTAMHPKTRYNIRLAEKHGVRIEQKKSFAILWNLLQKTGERDKFSLHPKKTYETVLSLPEVEQFVAYSNDTPVATVCLIRFGSTVSYLYGASDHNYRDAMAPYLLQWKSIQYAKDIGAKQYDFFGIAPSGTSGLRPATEHEYNTRHRYKGVTRFKLGFGGNVLEDPGTFDIIISPISYLLFSLTKTLRSFIHL